MRKQGCIGCARLLVVVNIGTEGQKFCTEKEGVLYLVDNEFYLKGCDEYCNEFKLKGVDWK